MIPESGGSRILLFSFDILDFRKGSQEKLTGGSTVQLSHWATWFSDNHYQVISFDRNFSGIHENIQYYRINGKAYRLGWFFQLIRILVKVRPPHVFYRCAGRDVILLALLSRIFRFRFTFMSASDTDFIKGSEIIPNKLDKRLYRIGVGLTHYFIVQNQDQYDRLKLIKPKSKVLIVPNIWYPGENQTHVVEEKTYDAIWIGNIREIKRPEVYLNLVKAFPDKKFVMVGGPSNQSLYEKIHNESITLKNLNFTGKLPIKETEQHLRYSKILVITSLHEGFPNTLLQALNYSIPIISTIDPSQIITKNQLGIYDPIPDNLVMHFKEIIENKFLYEKYKENCLKFMKENYLAKPFEFSRVEAFLN